MTLKTDIDQLVEDAALVHSWAHGGTGTSVVTDGGTVRSPAKLIADKAAEIDAAAGSVPTVLGYLTAAQTAEEHAETAQALAELARDAAREASLLIRGFFATTAKALSKGVVGLASLVGGSGGTNGTFALAFSGGAGTGAAGVFTVAGGIVISYTITFAGDGYTSAPTVSFAASSGLTGASATSVIANNTDAGEYFATPSPVLGESFLFYQNVAGVATEVTRLPSSSCATYPNSDRGYGLSFRDNEGRTALAFDHNYRLKDSETFARDVIVASGVIAIVKTVFEKHGLTITQKDWNILYWMGQSLACGWYAKADGGTAGGNGGYGGTGATTALTTAQPFNNKMIGKLLNPDASAVALSALVEQVQNVSGLNISGETGLASATAQASFLRKQKLDFWEQASSWLQDWIAGSSGLSAAALTAITVGTTPYNNAKAAVTKMKALAGASCAFRALTFYHGETDTTNATAQATYKAGVNTLWSTWKTDVAAITSQTDSMVLLLSQPSTHGKLSSSVDLVPIAALAFLEMHEAAPGDVFLIGPQYQYDYCRNDSITAAQGTNVDGLHLSAHGYRHRGAKEGQVLHQVFTLGLKWEPLRPTVIKRVASDIIEIEFIVPVKPLVLDTDLVSDPGDYGFVVYDGSDVELTISNVWVSAPDKVRIRMAAALSASYSVSYAYKIYNRAAASSRWSGARGNLRDSDNTETYYKGLDGKSYPMFNWCVLFKKAGV